MDTAIAVLLISALTTTGLLALWTATSRRHWFLRTAAFLAVLSPLLLVPAFEPFVALALQGGIVAGGVAVAGALGRKRRKELEGAEAIGGGAQWRFSMATLLLAMVLCGVAAAVASQAPRLNWYAWQSVALIGICGGAAILLGLWAATRSGWRRWLATGAALVAAAGVGAAPAWFDWFIPSFDDFAAWPPEPATGAATWLTPTVDRPLLIWIVIVPSVVLGIFIAAWLAPTRYCLSQGLAHDIRTEVRHVFRLAATIAIAIAMTAPAAWALFILLTPDAIPITNDPLPNGYDDFAAAARLVDSMPIPTGTLDVATATEAQLQIEMKASDEALKRVRIGLEKRSQVPVDYRSPASLPNISGLRGVSRTLEAEGRLHRLQGRPHEALNSYLDAMEFGVASCRGGLMIDGLVGMAMSTLGAKGVHGLRGELDADSCREGAQRIWRAIANLEVAEAFHARDRIWAQHASGWHGRLHLALNELTEEHFWDLGPESFYTAMDRQVAVARMTALELIARAQYLESGHWPQSLDALVSAIAPADASLDPFDPTGKRLRLLEVDDGVVIYSVGTNGIDEGGAIPNFETEADDGDLRLDDVFAPEAEE